MRFVTHGVSDFISYDMESDVKDKFLLVSKIILGFYAKGILAKFEYMM